MDEKIIKQAEKLQDSLVQYRRYLHKNAEVGFDLPKTSAFVENTLRDMGYAVERCGKNALVATLGGGNCVLLRADMDGLPIREKAKLPYACTSGRMHACGHDMHTAMLLGGAKLLKDNENSLQGGVALLFQPAEEILQGAKEVVESGLLKQKKVKSALSMHVVAGTELSTGTFIMQKGIGAPSADYFTVEVEGKGCHGSSPWQGRDPISCAARILLGLQEIPARELSLNERAVLSVGCFQSGETGNVIPNEATIKGTLRAYEESTRERIKKRLNEIAKKHSQSLWL
jgi:hippurate hydrolase